MNAEKKIEFILQFSKAVQGAILEKVKKMPEDWDGIEIMWLYHEYCIERAKRFRPVDFRKLYKKYKVERDKLLGRKAKQK